MNKSYRSLRATLGGLVLVVCIAGCKKEDGPAEAAAPTPPTVAEAAPTSVPDAAAAPPVSTIDCGAVLTEADLAELCGGSLALATPVEDQDSIGPDRTCSRRFTDGAAGSLAIMLMRLDAPTAFAPAEAAWTNVEPLSGIGDEARSYEQTSRGGDQLYKLELRKGVIGVLIFTSSLQPGTEPCVKALEAVAGRVATRLP